MSNRSLKALKSHPQIERPRRISDRIHLSRYTADLVLTLVGLINAGLMQRRRSHTVSILLGTGARTALPGDPFRLGFIRLSRVLWLSLLVVMLGGLLEPEAAAQTVSFGLKTDFGTGSYPLSVEVGDFNGDGKLDLAVANRSEPPSGTNISGTVSILLGTGTGSFGAKTDFGTGAIQHQWRWAISMAMASSIWRWRTL
jgi:FG-GAP repeat